MEIQISQILFQMLNFGIVLFVLNKFLYKPIVNILQQRQKKVAMGMRAAEDNLKTQTDLEKTKQKLITQAQEESQRIIKDAKKAARKETDLVLKNARQEAAKVIDKERASLQNSIKREREALDKQFASLVKDTTGQLLRRYLSKADHDRIISAQTKDLKSITF